MTGDRESLIRQLGIGDIFHAEYPNGASCICLVPSVSDDEIKSKRITTQQMLAFNRQTGMEDVDPDQPQAIINSVAALPPEIHKTFLGLNKRYETLMSMDEVSRFADLETHKLTDAEKKALIFVGSHYASNPLPPS